MDELVAVSAVIGDRSYRIKIQPGDEEVVRKTIKTVNDKIIEFKTQFSGKDMQDYIAMVLIWYATQASSSNANPELEKELAAALLKMEEQLDKAI